jgi:two-component system sensor histidine kinase YesM
MLTAAVGVTGFVAHSIAARELEQKSIQLGRESLERTAQVLDERLRKVIISVSAFMLSTPYEEMMNDVALNEPSRFYKHVTALQPLFNQAYLYEPLIDSMFIATPLGTVYPSTEAFNRSVDFYDSAMYEVVQASERAVWISAHEDPFFRKGGNVVSFVMRTVHREEPSSSYMVVNLKEEEVVKLFASQWNNLAADYVLIDSEGKPVLSATEASDSILQSDDGKLVYATPLTVHNGWKLYGMIDRTELLEDIGRIKWTTAFVTLLCLLMAFMLTGWLTTMLLRPLYRLKALMKRVEQSDLRVRFESPFQDEISLAGFRFNAMLEQIEALLREVKRAESDKTFAEIKALQAQINPHFLYNTLYTIYWKCQLNQLDDVKGMLLILSKLFQLGLNKGRDMTSLDLELQHATAYMELQQQCYVNMFDYRIDVDEEVPLDCEVLKMLLQPLVENCVLHGFKERSKKGEIMIQVSLQSSYLIIEVTDNGMGLDAERVMKALKSKTGDQSGFALWNVYRRLKLYYSDRADIQIESVAHEYTTIRLLIPEGGGKPGYE